MAGDNNGGNIRSTHLEKKNKKQVIATARQSNEAFVTSADFVVLFGYEKEKTAKKHTILIDTIIVLAIVVRSESAS